MAKNKLKTNSGAAKRFRIKKSGKIKRKKAGMRHNLSTRTKSTKMGLRQMGHVRDVDAQGIRNLMPNG